jgi:hypothetical protein
MHIRLAHGAVRGHPSFPAFTRARAHVHHPLPRRVQRPNRRERPRTSLPLRDQAGAAAACAALFVVAALILAAAVVAPHTAPPGPVDAPWRTAAAAGPLPYAHSHTTPLLPGSGTAGLDLPYRHR